MTTPPKKPVATLAKPVPPRQRIFIPRNTAEWSYTYLIGSAAGVLFLARFLTDGPVAGLCFLVPAAIGYFLRWPYMPLLSVIGLTYFLFAPGLIPQLDSNTLRIRLGHFDPMNMILAMAVLVYLISQYRLYTMSERAMPNDLPDSTKKDPDIHLRKLKHVPAGEWTRFFFVTGFCVIAAEFVWLGITELYVEPAMPMPIKLARPPGMEVSRLPGSLLPPASRLLLTGTALAIFFIVTKFAFWYWRLRRLNLEEASATIADMGWSENRREHLRMEYWQAKVKRSMKRDAT